MRHTKRYDGSGGSIALLNPVDILQKHVICIEFYVCFVEQP